MFSGKQVYRILPILPLVALVVWFPCPAEAQTFTILHSFTGAQDGAAPMSGLIMDRAGNLYGTTSTGGAGGAGTVFRLTSSHSQWVFSPLYSFTGGIDGGTPALGGLTIGPHGLLYGTAQHGGTNNLGCNTGGCGVAYTLRPPLTPSTSPTSGWAETVIHDFSASNDGWDPTSNTTFDSAGNAYGTTVEGSSSFGTVWKLSPSGNGWTESILTTFNAGTDGMYPYFGVTFDSAGNLYGTTNQGGQYGAGMVYELINSNGSWTKKVLYNFQGANDGGYPVGGVIFDARGNLYGTTTSGGIGGGGTAYRLSPSGDVWNFDVIYSFNGPNFSGPQGNLAMDAAGDLYGTTLVITYNSGLGSVFKLTPANGQWSYTLLHGFAHGQDGAGPYGTLLLDGSGNLYGTTSAGGEFGNGVVFKITP